MLTKIKQLITNWRIYIWFVGIAHVGTIVLMIYHTAIGTFSGVDGGLAWIGGIGYYVIPSGILFWVSLMIGRSLHDRLVFRSRLVACVWIVLIVAALASYSYIAWRADVQRQLTEGYQRELQVITSDLEAGCDVAKITSISSQTTDITYDDGSVEHVRPVEYSDYLKLVRDYEARCGRDIDQFVD